MFVEIPVTERDTRGRKRSLIHGRGVNDAPYLTKIMLNDTPVFCPFFLRWKTMLDRCYSSCWLKKHPTYQGCEVCPEWLSFMNFRRWMEKQDWQDNQLDKDLLSLGQAKVYSPDTCLFVSPLVNSLFLSGTPKKSDMPIGIYPRGKRFEVGCSDGTGRKYIGTYDTLHEAIDAYVVAKRAVIAQVIKTITDSKVRKAIAAYGEHHTHKLLLQKAMF